MVNSTLIGVERPQPKRIGVFGGTFDPLHCGHLALALEVRDQLELDRMLLVVANDPWQKTACVPVTLAKYRFEMVAAAVGAINATSGSPILEASDYEIRRGGQTYTADTLATLAAENDNAELFVIVGSDIAASLDTWKRTDEIQQLATTVVALRGGKAAGCPPQGWPHVVVSVPSLEISSTDVRDRFRDGRPVEALIPLQVADYVRTQRLYGSAR